MFFTYLSSVHPLPPPPTVQCSEWHFGATASALVADDRTEASVILKQTGRAKETVREQMEGQGK